MEVNRPSIKRDELYDMVTFLKWFEEQNDKNEASTYLNRSYQKIGRWNKLCKKNRWLTDEVESCQHIVSFMFKLSSYSLKHFNCYLIVFVRFFFLAHQQLPSHVALLLIGHALIYSSMGGCLLYCQRLDLISTNGPDVFYIPQKGKVRQRKIKPSLHRRKWTKYDSL